MSATTMRSRLLATKILQLSSFALNQPFRPAGFLATRSSSTLPTVASPSFWASMIPKPLRRKGPPSSSGALTKSQDWNPATFFIVMFLFIGSMSIQMIALRNEFTSFSRRADAKIGLLKEVIGRIQNGEEVDVEGLLGTGDPAKEKEWEEVLQEIQNEDDILALAEKREQKRVAKVARREELEAARLETNVKFAQSEQEPVKFTAKSNAPRGFY